MTFGRPWNVEGIRPRARDTAREAARRSGMSLGEWLNEAIIERAAEEGIDPPRGQIGHRDDERLAAIYDRLADVAEHLGRLDAASPRSAAERNNADSGTRQLAEAIARLDHRIGTMVSEGRRASSEIERRVLSMDRALNDLGRTRLQAAYVEPMPTDDVERAPRARAAKPDITAARADITAVNQTEQRDLAGLELQLRQISRQIDALARPCKADDAIDVLRADLAEIKHRIGEAMPSRSLDAIESEIRGLAARLDADRNRGIDPMVLAGVERGLAEVRDVLRSLTPAERLIGFDEAVHGLSQKIDAIVAGQQDPHSLQQIDAAIAALRGLMSQVASSGALANVARDVRVLADRLERQSPAREALANIDKRVAAVADALEKSRNDHDTQGALDATVKSISDKLDRMKAPSPPPQLEDRITTLVEKLDASEARFNRIAAIERGLTELTAHLEEFRARSKSLPVEALQNDVADLKQTQSASARRTEDSLESMHGTIGHVVGRLAQIEQDLRKGGALAAAEEPVVQALSLALRDAVTPTPVNVEAPAARAASASNPGPTSVPSGQLGKLEGKQAPSPATPSPATLSPATLNPGAASPGAASAGPTEWSGLPRPPDLVSPKREGGRAPSSANAAVGADVTKPMRSPSGRSESSVAETTTFGPPAMLEPARASTPTPQPALDPELPPDTPLEPGTGRQRVAAAKISRVPAPEPESPAPIEPTPQAEFIAAARRAAQAAANGGRGAASATQEQTGGATKSFTQRVRSLFLAAGVLVVAAGLFQAGLSHVGAGEAETSEIKPVAERPRPIEPSAHADTPTVVSGLRAEKSALNSAVNDFLARHPPLAAAVAEAPRVLSGIAGGTSPAQNDATEVTVTETTASVTPAAPAVAAATPEYSGPVPVTPGSVLQAGLAAGQGAAAYELGCRYADGRGVTVNVEQAALWFDRAAHVGSVPAMFRLAALYEKGDGIKKDLQEARRLYLAAAERGHAKAMHNLGVLFTQGIDGKPDYAAAAQWFLKAASFGVADSQYNLGILFSRGVGVTASLTDAYKWFALAAAQGDKDASARRDEIAARLDPQALATAELAAQTFVAEPEPSAASSSPEPAGGWDRPVKTQAPRSKAASVAVQKSATI
jgi:localization factor PodJL